MRRIRPVLALAALLAGCGVPRQEPVKREESHTILREGGASVGIWITEKSAYNLSLGDYSVPVDPRFRPEKAFRMLDRDRGRKVEVGFVSNRRGSGAEVLVRLDKPWAPGTMLDLLVSGSIPETRLESPLQNYGFIVPGSWRSDYQSASGQQVNYIAHVELPAGTKVGSATKGYWAAPATAPDGVDHYVWEGKLSPGKSRSFSMSYQWPERQEGGG